MTSKCGKNKKVAHEAQPSVSLMFLPQWTLRSNRLLSIETTFDRNNLRSNWLAFLIAPSFPRTLSRNDMTEINYFLDFRFHAYFYLFTVYRSGTLHGRTHVVWINLRESTFKSTSFRQMRHVEVWQFIVKLLTYPAGLSVFSLVDSRGEPKCHHWKFTNWSRLNPSLKIMIRKQNFTRVYPVI